MKVRNVLVFPAGTEIGLEIWNALKDCKEVRVFGAGQDISNHAIFAFPEYHVLPSVHENHWLGRLVALCKELSIDYIFPAHDDVVVALSSAQPHIPATVITSSEETCRITRSKSETYRQLEGLVKVPRVFSNAAEVGGFPVLVKPDRGQGSFGIRKVNDSQELAAALAGVKDAIICEYLPGEEYTVDCFSDRERGVLFASARIRIRTRNGISVNTRTESLPEAREMAEVISRKLRLRGAWFFQLKRDLNGKLTLLELAPRIAGAMAAHRVMGVNFPLLSIFEQERLPIHIRPNTGAIELDRALANRYRHAVEFDILYVDLDDTLVHNGQVNTRVIKLVFQCINEGRPVKLLTRHKEDLQRTLATHRLAGLFDEVIHIAKGERKSDHITAANAIFVDDSFAERMDVHERRGIPTFDCSMIEVLTEQIESMSGEKNVHQ